MSEPVRPVIRVRRGTAARWAEVNPFLARGEPGYETDTGRVKFGNGVDKWNSLAYAGGGGIATIVNVSTNARRHYGQGPPGTIIGSSPGDEYLDTLTGNLYRLE